jgi:hypothetical protein
MRVGGHSGTLSGSAVFDGFTTGGGRSATDCLCLLRGFSGSVFGHLAPVKVAKTLGQTDALFVRQLSGQLMRLNSL